ncbi:YggS family pyridoxal phosphate-dependent enzyme [Pelistega suis]|uniref:YggS family pyridoxal phosphate-dependent enzyme n=1 Tax=Pelistega suis TaxID=1631957 RepID=UPI00211C7BDD|nr:YggS family pyridoxal phosphate-dependent enzyme [Pelistega suis]MCQ9327861.1 YggS family pyridoxal phosphate-dependent enzyme [Pelistega suis]
MMLAENFKNVTAQLAMACEKAGREPSSLSLLPVSKTFSAEVVAQAAQLGYRRFGENKAQELKQKAQELADLHLSWVIIGHLQTNKAKEVAKYADEIQSLDRLELAVALDKRLQQEGRSLDALIQVKTSTEESKTGMLPEEVPAFLDALKGFDTLRIKGFMTIAENSTDSQVVRECFRQVRELAEKMRQQTGLPLPVLSMGMSGDFELAIAEGATEVRIGSAIFGARHYPPSA